MVWFFPIAWAIAFIPVVAKRTLGVELPQEVFLSGAALLGGLLPVVVITRMVDGPAGLDALRGCCRREPQLAGTPWRCLRSRYSPWFWR
jgi:hypothetical protein